jgi:hypothetical protein
MQMPNGGGTAKAKATSTYSRIDEKITLPADVPLTCDQKRL